jgi:hypothetical protein
MRQRYHARIVALSGAGFASQPREDDAAPPSAARAVRPLAVAPLPR